MRTAYVCLVFLLLAALRGACPVSAMPSQQVLEQLFRSEGPFEQRPWVSNTGIILVADTQTGRTATLRYMPGLDVPCEFRVGVPGKATGKAVSQEAALSQLKQFLANYLPPSFKVEELEVFREERDGDRYYFHLAKRYGEALIPPILNARIHTETGQLMSLMINSLPSDAPEATQLETKLTADEAEQSAIQEVFTLLAKERTLPPETVKKEYRLAVSRPASLWYLTSRQAPELATNALVYSLGLHGEPIDGQVRLERLYPNTVLVMVDAHSGYVYKPMMSSGAAPESNSPVPSQPVGQASTPAIEGNTKAPVTAYALAALAVLLVIFLVVKLRKR